jgi:inner membrane protein
MEPITQGLLGAATGQLVAGRRIGRQALLFGALVGMAPDLDVVLSPLHDGFGEWLYHRGTTHSLWFGFAAGPPIGWLLRRWRDPGYRTPLSAWIALSCVALVTHPLLDGFTAYGTQFFAPFSRVRFAWNGVSIVDPIYTLLLGAGVLWAARRSTSSESARRALVAGLTLSTLYLGIGLAANQRVVRDLERVFEAEAGISTRVRAYPTILQPWLRHFVVQIEDQRYVGFHTLFEPGCPTWRVHRLPPMNPRIERALASWQGQLMIWFADGDVGIEERPMPFGSSVVIDDLRYAWSDPEARGMWGIEARFDSRGEPYAPIRRISRVGPGERDLGRMLRIIGGDLPGAAEGWTRPIGCEPARVASRAHRLRTAETGDSAKPPPNRSAS